MTYDDLLTKIKTDHATAKLVNAAGGIRDTLIQSDKLGYDWQCYYVNDVLVNRVYVEQVDPKGTADNPIAWAADVPLIPNAYYIYDVTHKVWMGEAGVTAAWDDENFVEF